MICIGSCRVFTTEIRIVQVVTQLTDGQRREIYLSPIIIGPAIAILVEPTATALHSPQCLQCHVDFEGFSQSHTSYTSNSISIKTVLRQHKNNILHLSSLCLCLDNMKIETFIL